MKKYLNSFLILLITVVLTIEVIINSDAVIDSARFSFTIWKDNIFPTLFPFFVASNLLIKYGFVELAGEFLKPLMYKLFKINGESSFVLILSMLSGFPSSAKYTKELFDNGLINDKEATKLLTFTHFPNPLFVIGTVSVIFLNKRIIGFFILISIYLSNIIIGIIFRNYHVSTCESSKISLKRAINNMKARYKKNKNFGIILTNTLVESINLLLLILGTISLFLIINKILTTTFNINDFNRAILSGVLEMTGGLKYFSLLNIPLGIKAIFSTMILAFGGLSVHTQVYSIIADTKIKYIPYLCARIIHVVLSGMFMYIFMLFI
ncbi:MAG: hypothetical protein E7166_02775 [Firmicutes bacterium]|nr:hypothetical protein [Bacillota bacterium]